FRWSAGTCATTYCHSDGNGGAANITSFTWASPTGGATLGCTGCHGGNRASAKPIATGKHQAHMNNYTTLGTTFGCAECHAKTVGNDTTIGNKLLHVNKFKDLSGARLGGSSTYSAATGCSATYCHTSGKKGQLIGVSGYTEPAQPKWTDAAWTNKCNGCHGGATSVAGEPTYAGGIDGAVNANSHARHISQLNITDSTGCAVCHRTTVDPTNPWRIVQSSSHLNGSIDVTFGASAGGGASYNGAGRTCSSVACHSDGNGSYGNPVWGSKLNCASCHPNLSGAHARHMGGIVLSAVPFYAYTANVSAGGDSFTLASYGFGCANCHPTDPSKHNNGVLDIELNASSGAGSLKMKNYSAALIGTVRTGGNVQCAGVYCHSDGRGGKNTTPLWNQTFAGLGVDRCAQCHGNSPTSGAHAAHVVGIHYKDVFNGYSSKVPQTANTTVASSHGDPNQSTTLNCNVCHADTVTYARNSQNTACVSCHNGDGATGLAQIGNLAKHVNGTVDIALTNVTLTKSKAQLRPVNFADYTAAGGFWSRNGGNFKNGAAAFDSAKTLSGAPSYDKPSTTCSNINCHMGNPVNWKNKLECSDCHKVL
ncbi:MAG TPA: CxxxxCH/CxxCH domain-containing protein, partial [Geobacteraceae bacterium]